MALPKMNWQDGLFSFNTELRSPWNNFFEPKAYDPGKVGKQGKPGEPKYGGTFLIPYNNPELAAAKEKLTGVINASWGSNWPATILAGEGLPLVDGQKVIDKLKAAGKSGNEGLYQGHVVLTARTLKQPTLAVWDPIERKIVTLDTDVKKAQYKGLFFGGCYCTVEVHFTPYEGFGGGVTAYLQTVMRTKDGPRTQGSDPTETFKDFMGSYTPDVDPTNGAGLSRPNMDQKLPF